MRVLLTNDDGIEAEGLRALRRALLALPGIELATVAPDGNRSATARSITTRRPLTVREVAFDDGTVGYATDGTPVDCVRLTNLGLINGFSTELVVSGINHGANLGDDVTYSGTVAAAMEGVILGLPALAASQRSPDPARGVAGGGENYDFTIAAAFVARLVERIAETGLPEGTLLNVNVPEGTPDGVRVARLGRRVYRDELEELEEDGAGELRRFRISGAAERGGEEGTDLAALAARQIAITPLHFDLTDTAGMDALARADLHTLLAPVADQAPEP